MIFQVEVKDSDGIVVFSTSLDTSKDLDEEMRKTLEGLQEGILGVLEDRGLL
jgi:hypothetical protein